MPVPPRPGARHQPLGRPRPDRSSLERSYRFSELRRAIGRVSEKMLAQTLQTLERDGFVHRDAKPVIPPRVDYSLTDLGREAAEQVRALARWTNDRMDDVAKAREAYDGART